MLELIIESNPSGAEVQIDGEVVGTTPLTLPITTIFEAFRAECLTAGAVSCDWNTLKTRLEDQTVSRLWWDLTETERRSIAEMAIKNTFFYTISQRQYGRPNCEGGWGAYDNASSATNSIIRYQKFAYIIGEMDACYWRRDSNHPSTCYAPHDTYNLPCFIVRCSRTMFPVCSLCAIQVRKGTDSIDNWVIFQYNNFDVKPGSILIPFDSVVSITSPQMCTCTDYTYSGVATFVIPPSSMTVLEDFRAECLSGGRVSCSWATLNARLEDQIVSELWWKLTYDERYSIALEATTNMFLIQFVSHRTGKSNCEGGEGEWTRPACWGNAVIRLMKFGTDLTYGVDWYYQDPYGSGEHCYVQDIRYNLPAYHAVASDVDVAHSIVAIQIGEDVYKLDSWLLFNYMDADIQPGNWQLPMPGLLEIHNPFGPILVTIEVDI